jgi:septin family protein
MVFEIWSYLLLALLFLYICGYLINYHVTKLQNTRCIIILCGKAGVGKDTFYRTMYKEKNYMRLAFADILKEIVSQIFKIPVATINSNKDTLLHESYLSQLIINSNDYNGISSAISAKTIKTFRDLLIFVATVIRKVDNLFFIKKIMSKINTTLKNIVITDCRFKAEISHIKSSYNNVTIMYLTRKSHAFSAHDTNEITEQDSDFSVSLKEL